jgi:hypothetical protein
MSSAAASGPPGSLRAEAEAKAHHPTPILDTLHDDMEDDKFVLVHSRDACPMCARADTCIKALAEENRQLRSTIDELQEVHPLFFAEVFGLILLS